MFSDFFLMLRDAGIPVSLKAFISFQKALYLGLAGDLFELYAAARSILVKSERYFDLYDRIFREYFEDAVSFPPGGIDPDEETAALLDKWLKDPAAFEGIDFEKLFSERRTPEQLLEYFRQRLEDQKERHDRGTKWIGTAGASPTGNSGYNPTGMRVGGSSSSMSALKVAGERRYRDYRTDGPLSESAMMEALRRLKHMVPHGPRDCVDIDETVSETMKNAGDIEIVFRQSLRNRLKVVLAIDNGGISMDPHIGLVKKIFDHAHSYFGDLKVFYFHNTIYDRLWLDPERRRHEVGIGRFLKRDPETRLIIVGDASMSPYELLYRNGVIRTEQRADAPGLTYLKMTAKTFRHSAWLNPVPEMLWQYTDSIGIIREIFPMFELSLNGLEKAVGFLTAK